MWLLTLIWGNLNTLKELVHFVIESSDNFMRCQMDTSGLDMCQESMRKVLTKMKLDISMNGIPKFNKNYMQHILQRPKDIVR